MSKLRKPTEDEAMKKLTRDEYNDRLCEKPNSRKRPKTSVLHSNKKTFAEFIKDYLEGNEDDV